MPTDSASQTPLPAYGDPLDEYISTTDGGESTTSAPKAPQYGEGLDQYLSRAESAPEPPASKPEAGFGKKALNTVEALGRGILDLPTYAKGYVANVAEGSRPLDADNTLDQWAKESQQLQRERATSPEAEEPTLLGTKGDWNQTFSSVPFSLGSVGGAVAGSAAAGALSGGNPAAAYAGGSAGSGALAYRADSAMFMRDALDKFSADYQKQNGRAPTQDEMLAEQERLQPFAAKHGLWEAVPEAVGTPIATKLLGGIFKPGGNLLYKTGRAMAGIAAEELPTETVTQVGQHNTEIQAGLSDGQERSFLSPSDIYESGKEVAVPVIQQSLLLGGGGGAIKAGYDRFTRKPENPTETGEQDAGATDNTGPLNQQDPEDADVTGSQFADRRDVGPNGTPAAEPVAEDTAPPAAVVNTESENPEDNERVLKAVDSVIARANKKAAEGVEPAYDTGLLNAMKAVGMAYDENVPAVQALKELQALRNPPKTPAEKVAAVTEDLQATLDAAPVKGVAGNAARAALNSGITAPQQEAAAPVVEETPAEQPAPVAETPAPEAETVAETAAAPVEETPAPEPNPYAPEALAPHGVATLTQMANALRGSKTVPEEQKRQWLESIYAVRDEKIKQGAAAISPKPQAQADNLAGLPDLSDVDEGTPPAAPETHVTPNMVFDAAAAEHPTDEQDEADWEAEREQERRIQQAQDAVAEKQGATIGAQPQTPVPQTGKIDVQSQNTAPQAGSQETQEGEVDAKSQYWNSERNAYLDHKQAVLGGIKDKADQKAFNEFATLAEDTFGPENVRGLRKNLVVEVNPQDGSGQLDLYAYSASSKQFYKTGAKLPENESGIAALKPAAETPVTNIHPVDDAFALAPTSSTNDLQVSEADLKDGKYPKPAIPFAGLMISGENRFGSMRRGTDPNGKKWEQQLQDNYGEISGVADANGDIKPVIGSDGDAVDIFIRPNMTQADIDALDKVYVVDQIKPGKKTPEFDEHKVVAGYPTEAEAIEAYNSNYQNGWKGLGAITEMSLPEFKEWLRSGDTTVPVSPELRGAEKPGGQRDSAVRDTEHLWSKTREELGLNRDTPEWMVGKLRTKSALEAFQIAQNSKREAHAEAVENALAKGEPVPAAVLNEYPGLKRKYAKTATPTAETLSTVTVNGKEIDLNTFTKEQRAAWNEADAAYATSLDFAERNPGLGDSERTKLKKAAAMRLSAARRQIAGVPTAKEAAAAEKAANTIREGSSVVTSDGESATVVRKPAFGKAKIQMENGSVKIVPVSELRIAGKPQLSTPIAEGSTGPVHREGDEAVKTATGNEAAIYALLNGVEGIVKGYEADGKIRTPFYKNVVSVDTIAPERRAQLRGLVAKNASRINRAISALTNAGYDYNDPLQFGLSDAKTFDLMDFSNAMPAPREDAIRNNLGHLSGFYKQFGAERVSNAVSQVADVLGYQRSMAEDADLFDFFGETVDGVDYRNLVDALNGAKAEYAYYATNARHIALKGIAQTGVVNDVNVVLSTRPLTENETSTWELTPVYESTLPKPQASSNGSQNLPTDVFTSAAEAHAFLSDKFGPGIDRLVATGMLNFTQGKESWPEIARQGTVDRDEAVYINGKAYLDLRAIGRDRLPAIVLHEIGEHYNLARMLGTPAYKSLQDQIANRAKIRGSQAEKIWNQVKRAYVRPEDPSKVIPGRQYLIEGDDHFLSEVIAKLGENDPKAPWYKRLLAQIKSFLLQHGLARGFVTGTMTEADLHELLKTSLRSAADGRKLNEARYYRPLAQYALDVWHGSPHDHDKFDSSKIGTGEGAQAFGFGHYFTNKKEIAEWYKKKLSGANKTLYTLDGVTVGYIGDARRALVKKATEMGYSAESAILLANELQNSDGDLDAAGGELRFNDNGTEAHEEAANLAQAMEYIPEGGKLYEVELAPEEDELLDWDKPLSEQSEKVRDAVGLQSSALVNKYNAYATGLINKYGSKRNVSFKATPDEKEKLRDLGRISGITKDTGALWGLDGQHFYKEQATDLGSDKAASDYLHSIGIRGIKYAAEGGKSDATNYVIFSDDDISIKAKYSRPQYSFAGEKAETADQFALSTAKDRISAGDDPETVRRETGWYQWKPDNRWRFEIDDSSAKLNIGLFSNLAAFKDSHRRGATVGDLLDHPKLFAAYPQLAKTPLAIVNRSMLDGANGGVSGNRVFLAEDLGKKEALSSLMHELQHGIQNVEGFAIGATPESVTPSNYKAHQVEFISFLKDSLEKARTENDNPKIKQLAEDLRKIQAAASYEAYKRVAGEVEARNVQTRLRMSAKERLRTPPERTQDVKDADTIVVFGGRELKDAPRMANVTPEQARKTNVRLNLPQSEIFKEAVSNTPGATMDNDGLFVDLVRYQKPEQDGAESVRTGVFYLPAGSASERHYRGGKNSYGGTVKHAGTTLIRNPLFVKGATGGKAPEVAFDTLKGKGAYEAMRRDVLSAIMGRKDEARIQAVLDKYGSESDAHHIMRNSTEGNTLAYAMQENIVAHAVREAGHDAVVGYSKGKAGHFISEIFDVREQTYPSLDDESDIHPAYFEDAPQYSRPAEEELPETITIGGVERPTRNSNGQFIHPTEDGIRNFYRWFGNSRVTDAEGRPLVVYHGTHADVSQFKRVSKAHLGFHFGDAEASDTRLGDTSMDRIDPVEVRRLVERYEEALNAQLKYEDYLRRKQPEIPNEAFEEALNADDVDAALGRLFNSYAYVPTAAEEQELSQLKAVAEARKIPVTKYGLGSNTMTLYLRASKLLRMPDVGHWGSPAAVKKALPFDTDAKTLNGLVEEIKAKGYDGIVYANRVENPVMRTDSYIAFNPNQIKSAIGNTGAFSPESNDIRYSRPTQDQEDSPAYKEWAKQVQNKLDESADKVFSQRLAFLSVRQIADYAKKILPGISAYVDHMEGRVRVVSERLREADNTLAPWKSLAKKDRDLLNQAMRDSTRAEVDPSLNWSGIIETRSQRFRVYTQTKFSAARQAFLDSEGVRLGGTNVSKRSATFTDRASAEEYLRLLNQFSADQAAYRAKNGYPDVNIGRQKDYLRLRQTYLNMSETQQKVFNKAHLDLSRLHRAKLQALVDRVNEAVLDVSKRKEMIAALRLRFEAQMIMGYYAPLFRHGEHWFYGKKDGKNYFRTFESEKGRDKARDEFIKSGGTSIKSGTSIRDLTDVKMEGGSEAFVLEVNKLIGSKELDPAVQKSLMGDIYQMYLDTLPEVSMRHSSQHRLGTYGEEEDQMQAYSHAMHHGATQLANMIYGRRMEQVLKDNEEAIKLSSDPYLKKKTLIEIEAAEDLGPYWTTAGHEYRDSPQRNELASAAMAEMIDGQLAEAVLAGDEEQEIYWTQAKELRSRFRDLAPEAAEDSLQHHADKLRAIVRMSNGLSFENNRKASDVVSELTRSYKAMVATNSTPMDQLAAYMRQVGFIWTLALGVSSAALNLVQTPGVALPVAVGKHGWKASTKAFSRSLKDFMQAGVLFFEKDANGNYIGRDADGNMSITESLKRQAMQTSDPAELDRLHDRIDNLEERKDDGTISRTQTFDVIGIGQEGENHSGALLSFTKKMGWMFHHGERFNREITLDAAYTLARDSGMSRPQASAYAKQVTDNAHGDYSSENAARIFRGWPSAIALQYKKYQQAMFWLWGKQAVSMIENRGWKNLPEGPEREAAKLEAQEAARTLGALFTMQVAAAGIFSMPATGALIVVLNALGNAAGDDDEPFDIEREVRVWMTQHFGETFATATVNGAINALTPVNASDRMNLKDVLFREPLQDKDGRDAYAGYVAQLAGPAGGTISKLLFEAPKLALEGHLYRAVETAMPKAVGDLLKAGRYQSEGLTSLKDEKLRDMSLDEVLLQAAGFSSSRNETFYAERGYAKAAEKAIKETRQAIVNRAVRDKLDGETVSFEEIRAWNKKHPEWPITGDSLRRSLRRTKQNATARGDRGYAVNPKLDYLYEQNALTETED